MKDHPRRTRVSADLPTRLAFFSTDDPDSGCRVWNGSTDGKLGYGKLYWQGRDQYAHRLAWEHQNNRTIPAGLVVMHSCDNPSCINPHHLAVGTQKQNVDDQFRRGRARRCRGSAHALSTLTAIDVAVIRSESASGVSHAGLARRFKVSATTIWRIVNHHSYKETAA